MAAMLPGHFNFSGAFMTEEHVVLLDDEQDKRTALVCGSYALIFAIASGFLLLAVNEDGQLLVTRRS